MPAPDLVIDPAAHALRPVRTLARENAFRYYTATTFPGDERGGCGLYLRRVRSHLRDDGSGLVIDVLNEDGDVIQDFPVDREGFAYLRRVLRFRVDKE